MLKPALIGVSSICALGCGAADMKVSSFSLDLSSAWAGAAGGADFRRWPRQWPHFQIHGSVQGSQYLVKPNGMVKLYNSRGLLDPPEASVAIRRAGAEMSGIKMG